MDEHLTKRFLPLEGVDNFRDVGGYQAWGHSSVKWNVLFRGGDMDTLTDADLKLLAKLGLKTVVDFRTQAEIAAAPDLLPESVTGVFNLAIDSGSVFALSEVNDATGSPFMCRLNRCLVNSARPQYAEFMHIMANPRNTPVLCHCSAGKDRTGLAVALFLASLGVNRDIIMSDYLISASLAEAKYRWLIDEYPALLPVMTVKKEYLDAAFDEIDGVYGGMERYLTEELNVDLTLMRRLYTESLS